MDATGVEKIDRLFTDADAPPLCTGNPDKEAVAVIQDLLICQGFVGLPDLFGSSRGIFGPRTTEAVRKFQNTHGLGETGHVDIETLRALISVPAIRPKACRGYLCLVLDFNYQGLVRLVSLTSRFEGAGSFSAFNANTDGAGLSYGLIQWAQKPGRLHELLCAFRDHCPGEFLKILGASDSSRIEGLLKHTSQPGGGVDRRGHTTDPSYDLTVNPWKTRFQAAALNHEMQKAQMHCAVEAFTRTYQHIRRYAPDLRSERVVAFMLDLANQHGDSGARSIFDHVSSPGLLEADLLTKLQEESVARVRRQFGDGAVVTSTRNRREAFRTSPLLSDEPFTVG